MRKLRPWKAEGHATRATTGYTKMLRSNNVTKLTVVESGQWAYTWFLQFPVSFFCVSGIVHTEMAAETVRRARR